jgi:hypothetical protein
LSRQPPFKRLKVVDPKAPLLDYSTPRLNSRQKSWTNEDEARLVAEIQRKRCCESMVAVDSVDWEELPSSKLLNKFSSREVFAHYYNLSCPSINGNNWTISEDEALISLAQKYEERDWSRIANELGTNRTPFACLKHYQQHLNRRLMNSEEWSAQEDQLLTMAVDKFSRSQSTLQLAADAVPFRTAAQCSNRWNRLSQRILTTSDWTPDEERMLYLAAVANDIPSLHSAGDSSITEQEGRKGRGPKWQNVAKLMLEK